MQRVEPALSLILLNGFELRVRGATIPVPPAAQRLVAYLALNDRLLLRVRVAGTLWVDAPEGHAFANLRSTLWRLRQCDRGLIEAAGPNLRLARDVHVDVRAATDLARRLLNSRRNDEALEVDLDALGGDLLPDWYDDWVLVERERFRQLRLHALEELCERLLSRGHLTRALEIGMAAFAEDPLRETAHRALILVHLAEGNRGEAMRQYQLCSRLLQERLGLEPSERIRGLVQGLGGAGEIGAGKDSRAPVEAA